MSEEVNHDSRPLKVTAEGAGLKGRTKARLDRWLEYLKGTAEGSGLKAETRQDELLQRLQLTKNLPQKQPDEVEQKIEYKKQEEKQLEENTKQQEKLKEEKHSFERRNNIPKSWDKSLMKQLDKPEEKGDEPKKLSKVGLYKKGVPISSGYPSHTFDLITFPDESIGSDTEESDDLQSIPRSHLRHRRLPRLARQHVGHVLPSGKSWVFSHKSSFPMGRNPSLLLWMCRDVLQKNRIVLEDRPNDTSTWSVSMQKDFKRYVGVTVHHKAAVLQAPGSEVILSIPSGLKAFVMGHIHTDPKPFLHAIPNDECLVAPIVDYTCMYMIDESRPPGAWFKISVPHCITNKKHLSKVRVRHGDIYKGVEFTELPSDNCHFEVDEHHITIFTSHFSQFICTVCGTGCQGSARALTFGALTPLTLPPVHSMLSVYICSPLYRINDYRQKLQEIEGRLQIKRHLVNERDVTWNPDDFREEDELCVAIQSKWAPIKPIKKNEKWDRRRRKLVQKRRASEIMDMKHCHICKTDPSDVATFSFTAPETANDPQVALKFSGRLVMSIRGHGFLLESDFHVFPTELCPAAQNDDHLRLRRVTKLVISTELELVDFGLGLGYSFEQVKQKRTNHSTFIENAAMDVVVEWWDTCPERYERKVELLVKVVDNIGKSKFVGRVREMMRKVDNEPEVNNNNNIPCAEEGASQISLTVPEMLPARSKRKVPIRSRSMIARFFHRR